eukprot:INCI14080.2.p1 GENE.INCI14080.2~~INCI14080.2.p1  ORF type:complete len:593 (+),score=98.55 INCI14080.2:259-2037(+)
MSAHPPPPAALAADAQISDQSLLTIMQDAQKYICTICENLQTHAGIQALRTESVNNNTNEIHTFIGYILAATQKSVITSLELPREKRLSISHRTPILLSDGGLARGDATSAAALNRIVQSVESLGLCHVPEDKTLDSTSPRETMEDDHADEVSSSPSGGGGGGVERPAAGTFETPSTAKVRSTSALLRDEAMSPMLPSPGLESLHVVEDIDKTLISTRASLRASFERLRSLGTPLHRSASARAGGGGASGEGGGSARGLSPHLSLSSSDGMETNSPDPAALARERNIQHAKIQQQLRIGTRRFNTEGYKAGLAYFGRYAGCKFNTPMQVAQFLRSAEGISRSQVGELLGKKDPFYREVALGYFSENYDVVGLELDQALRVLLTGNWMLHYESVNYMMGIFAEVFLTQNPNYKLKDRALLQGLANALVMLNGFQHNVQSKRTAMSLRRFTELVRSFDITEAHLTAADVKGFYKRISKTDISPQPSTTNEMTEAVLNYPTKRMMGRKLNRKGKRDRTYFVLREGCLFFFDKSVSFSFFLRFSSRRITASGLDTPECFCTFSLQFCVGQQERQLHAKPCCVSSRMRCSQAPCQRQ